MIWWLAARLYRSRALARALFGVRCATPGPDDHLFDVTTIVLVRRARQLVGADTRVVDLGTGSQA